MPKISFIDAQGERTTVEANVGESLMELAVRNGVDGVVAECGGCLSCATCHTYIPEEWAGRVPSATEMEKIMIDCAIGVRPTSRLSCQIFVTEEMDGLEVEVPATQY